MSCSRCRDLQVDEPAVEPDGLDKFSPGPIDNLGDQPVSAELIDVPPAREDVAEKRVVEAVTVGNSDPEHALRAQDPSDLGERALVAGKMFESVVAKDQVDRPVCERDLFCQRANVVNSTGLFVQLFRVQMEIHATIRKAYRE